MFSRVQVEDPGDSPVCRGDIVSKAGEVDANALLAARGQRTCTLYAVAAWYAKVSIWRIAGFQP